MDGLRRPVGDQPAGVYWFRRALVLVAVVLVIAMVWFIIRGIAGGGEGEPADDPAAEPTVTTSPQAGADPDASDDPGRPCTAEDVTLTSTANPDPVTVGTMPAFEVDVEHTGTFACRLSTATEGTEFSVRSGDNVFYSTGWCPEDPVFEDAEWILQPGDREALQVTWNGSRYDDQCEVIAEPAAGFYWASVAVGGIAAEETQFEMVD